MAIYSVFRVLILVILCTVCEAGSCVYAYSSYTVNNGQHSRHTITGAIYCTSGCCGYYNERECCSDSTAAIVTGSVLGGIVLIGVVAGIITCCCHYKNKREVVVQPVYYITADAQLERITELPSALVDTCYESNVTNLSENAVIFPCKLTTSQSIQVYPNGR